MSSAQSLSDHRVSGQARWRIGSSADASVQILEANGGVVRKHLEQAKPYPGGEARWRRPTKLRGAELGLRWKMRSVRQDLVPGRQNKTKLS